MTWEPRIVAILCRWCAYAGADLAGVSRLKYPPNVIPIRVPCSGRVDPQFILEAFENGADGVLIGGCHIPSDCHYVAGNFKAMKRIAMVRKMLEVAGIEPERVRLEWISASEGEKFARVVEEFTETIRKLGPLEREVKR
jgi:F420-non-reducing hydrogenase iron-sulfur subunit